MPPYHCEFYCLITVDGYDLITSLEPPPAASTTPRQEITTKSRYTCWKFTRLGKRGGVDEINSASWHPPSGFVVTPYDSRLFGDGTVDNAAVQARKVAFYSLREAASHIQDTFVVNVSSDEQVNNSMPDKAR